MEKQKRRTTVQQVALCVLCGQAGVDTFCLSFDTAHTAAPHAAPCYRLEANTTKHRVCHVYMIVLHVLCVHSIRSVMLRALTSRPYLTGSFRASSAR